MKDEAQLSSSADMNGQESRALEELHVLHVRT